MPDETCWTLVEGAAGGDERAREDFARLYAPVVRAYLQARWSANVLRREVEDAAQEVFVDLIRPNGALSRVRRDYGDGGFRSFLLGVVRNVAKRHEERAGRQHRREQPHGSAVPQQVAEGDSPSRAFDAAWARAIMRTAARRHAREAEERGEEAIERVELLRLRFRMGLPIREVAARWQADPATVHRQYARARREFAAALYRTVELERGGTPAEIRHECERLLTLLR